MLVANRRRPTLILARQRRRQSLILISMGAQGERENRGPSYVGRTRKWHATSWDNVETAAGKGWLSVVPVVCCPVVVPVR
jgi:hypothetical protein